MRISGQAEVLADRALLQEIWDANPLLRHYLGSLDNPELIVYRIVPEQVRFMREWSLEYHDVPIDAPARNAPWVLDRHAIRFDRLPARRSSLRGSVMERQAPVPAPPRPAGHEQSGRHDDEAEAFALSSTWIQFSGRDGHM